MAETPANGGRAGLAGAGLTALGIVYGDLGTSPLYTLQTVVEAMGGHFTTVSALGVLSLIVWTLIITVSIKYGQFVMRADNHGEGGILALMSLIGSNSLRGKGRWLTAAGLLGAALIYGDGVITPSISVLSALEGVNVVTSSLKPYIMPLACLILFGLFVVQRFGTASIGKAFGPVMLLWFIVIAVLGLSGIIGHPVVLLALSPTYAITFLAHSGAAAPFILGGAFLAITGGEAMYADMGHIGREPIRLSWYGLVLPALLLSYAGQTGLLIAKGHITGNPFFQLAPAWAVYPLVALATLATIIASQAIITGAFSMTRQAMQLGWLPGVSIRQTSDEVYGQIYVPAVNWLMMVGTIGVTVAFRSSDHLAGAYGTAVSTTMMLTTCLLFNAMRDVWRWPLLRSALVCGVFLVVDVSFFAANLFKIADGGWLPLAVGFGLFFIMSTWREGVDAMHESLAASSRPAGPFLERLREGKTPRVPGVAIFLTRARDAIPSLLVDHIRHMGALQQNVITLTIKFLTTPRVAAAERCKFEPVGDGILHAEISFGFVEIPNLERVLADAKDLPPDVDLNHAVFFAARDQVVHHHGVSRMPRWRLPVFGFLFRNALKVVDRFSLPPDNVVEIGRQVQI
ncbi:MAG: KUP/HAK/KT family potassium transporter [Caulobacteraceae bacterium]